MKLLACNYSVIRFLPFRDTGEFINIGIVLCCPETGLLDFKLSPANNSRITAFFATLEPDLADAAIRYATQALQARRSIPSDEPGNSNFDFRAKAMADFQWLSTRRESLIRFSEPGGIISENPGTALNELYSRYVTTCPQKNSAASHVSANADRN